MNSDVNSVDVDVGTIQIAPNTHIAPAARPIPRRIEATWRIRTGQVVIGPKPRTILQLRAVRDAEITTMRLDFPEFLHPSFTVQSELRADMWVIEQPACHGKRYVKCERAGGRQQVVAVADIDHGKLPDGDPFKCWRAGHVIGECGIVVYNFIESPVWEAGKLVPRDFWQWLGRLKVTTPVKGQVLGIVARANKRTVCSAMVAGL